MYRLQLTPDFGFAEAAEIGEYLADLGVTHAYLSPVLEAVPGSLHGYDVTDHSRIRGELGGEEGFRAMAKRLRGLGLGVVLDIVPNHMAVPANLALNRQLWSVLRDGRGSPYAPWFDIDWTAQDDRMLLPILGAPLESSLGDLRVEAGGGPDGEPTLRYFAKGNTRRGAEAFEQALTLDPRVLDRQGLSMEGEDRGSLVTMNYFLAQLCARSGRPDAALVYLNRAIAEGFRDYAKLQKDDAFASVRGMPEFPTKTASR